MNKKHFSPKPDGHFHEHFLNVGPIYNTFERNRKNQTFDTQFFYELTIVHFEILKKII